MPPELFATTPPTVAKSVLAGSGPRRRLYGLSSTRFTWPSAVPGRTLATAPSSSTFTPVKWRRTSTRIPSLWPWPFRLVPAERSVTGMSLLAAEAEHLGDVAGVMRLHHRLREEAVGAGVGGVA